MIKNILLTLLIGVGSVAALNSFPHHNYSIFGSGVGAIMVDAKTGETWVLERQNLVPSTQGSSLERSADFCSPTGECYYWVPASVLPRYKEAIGVGCNPEETRKADADALFLWQHKIDLTLKRLGEVKK